MDDRSFAVLQAYKSRGSLTLDQLSAIFNNSPLDVIEPLSHLRQQKLIRVQSNYATLHNLTEESGIEFDMPFEITFAGKAALEAEIKARRHLTFNELRAWITLGIAVAGFALSVIALISQSG